MVQKITEQCLITFTDEKTWELANQPFPEPPRELRIAGMFEAMQHQRANQNLASRVLPPLLFAQSGLERSLALIELVDALLDGCTRQGSDPYNGGTKPDMLLSARRGKPIAQVAKLAIWQSCAIVGFTLFAATHRNASDIVTSKSLRRERSERSDQGRTYELPGNSTCVSAGSETGMARWRSIIAA
jgi:hypothetical protein